MDSLITATARALALGDPLGALKRVALRNDAPALALRGIAMAQLGDFERAKTLLKKAARSFGMKEPIARARCIVAEAEIALASRDLSWPANALDGARALLEAHGDWLNAVHARQLQIRRLVLIGRLDEAEQALAEFDPKHFSPALSAIYELMTFGIAVRRLHIQAARAALQRAERSAQIAAVPALSEEILAAGRVLTEPAARIREPNGWRLLHLDEVERLFTSKSLLIDACRYVVRAPGAIVELARRPILFLLARELGLAWPDSVPRNTLIARVFRIKKVDDSHRARLRVEIGRLRSAIKGMAAIDATKEGFVMMPHASNVALLAPPVEDPHAQTLALLADGESWSSSSVAIALGASQRSVQRSLEALASNGKVQAIGRGRARRWMAPPLPGFATTLLLPALLPND